MNGTAARPLGSKNLLAGLAEIAFERPLKTRDSARDLGALARVLSASDLAVCCRTEAKSVLFFLTTGDLPLWQRRL